MENLPKQSERNLECADEAKSIDLSREQTNKPQNSIVIDVEFTYYSFPFNEYNFDYDKKEIFIY